MDGATRMQNMIKSLLMYSRTSRDQSPLLKVDCSAVIEDVKKNLQISIQESGAVIQTDLLPTVIGYPMQLVQLFQNLISNSIKFKGASPPRVNIKVGKNDTHWQFSVNDNGIGMDPQYFERIFIIFQRLHSNEEYPGTGIGLAVCKKIVERHQGKIWVESVVNQGTTINFTISSQLKEQ